MKKLVNSCEKNQNAPSNIKRYESSELRNQMNTTYA